MARQLQLTFMDPAEADPSVSPRDAQTGRLMRHDELPLARALTGERVTDLEYRQGQPVGADSWIRASAAPMLGPHNTISGAVVVCTDVTAERLAEQARTIALASAGHELRTPLTSALGFAGLLMAGQLGSLSQKQIESIGRIQFSLERLRLLIEDIMNLSTIESGHSELRPGPVDIGALLARTIQSFQPQIQRKHQEIVLLPPSGEIVAWADEHRLEQVISNLVSNAHKYTLDGGRITLSAVQDAAGTLVTVTDTGVGLTPAEIHNLFTKFYRARNPATWNVPGTGLGLAIARALIERHGGSISIASAPGKGSTFEIRLPPGRIQH
jgi:signal transduction histidine kinase